LDDPTTVVFSPRGEVFVAEEGAGRISRLNAQGEATVVAEGLGKPRDIEFVDERTLLVSDQENGRVWKVVLP
jgi:glucose/arabinose dehydrogenase